MCGVVGIFNRNGENVSPVSLRKMADAVAHRGPDGEGFYTDNFLGIGHRRLAILDLSSAGHQPMVSNDQNFVITYNGEIYNYRELRVELESIGYSFRSQSDTEVLLNAYAAWGEGVLKRLNGMFAFAVWDRVRQELFIARDRYGIKPLYTVQMNSLFGFASEVKALLAIPGVQTDLDEEGLIEYFTFQNFFTPKTLFKGIHLFPAGHFQRIPLGTGAIPTPVQYWDYAFEEPEQPSDEREYVEELDRLFGQAVNRQLISDVEVGSYLSGGMDSGAIVAIAAKSFPNLKTFTCGFDLHSASGLEMGFDERERAEHMSYLFQTEHYEMVLKAGDMERCLPALSRHIEEPRVGQSYPNYYVARLASKFVKVVLGGTGGDELFGGYPWRYYRAVDSVDFEDYIDKYYRYWQRLIPNKVIRQVFAPIWDNAQNVWTRDIFHDVFSEHAQRLSRPEDYVNHCLYFEAKTFLHGLLMVDDKLNMAHGLEKRVPFLDNDLVDFAMKLPVNLKLGNLTEVLRLDENEPLGKKARFYNKTRDGKLLLRKMMQRHVPEEISAGIKQGFSAPDASWFRGDSIDYVKEMFFDEKARIYEYMAPAAVQDLIQEHLGGQVNRRLLIWSLISFEWWCRKFLN